MICTNCKASAPILHENSLCRRCDKLKGNGHLSRATRKGKEGLQPRSFVGSLPLTDVERLNRIRDRLGATSNVEAMRRALVTMESLLTHQDEGGDIVLCRQGMADKAVWFV
jgi:hypothetical protein